MKRETKLRLRESRLISKLFSVFLLFLFNQSFEINLHALPVQHRRGFFQLNQLLNKSKSLQVQITGGRSLYAQKSIKWFGISRPPSLGIFIEKTNNELARPAPHAHLPETLRWPG